MMTEYEFAMLCNSHLIEPSIALENQNVINTLKDSTTNREQKMGRINTILLNEF